MTISEQEVFGSGRYLKTCRSCKKPFRTDARNARFGPPELCKCLEKRKKGRLKRAKERRRYHKNPEYHQKHSRIRAEARKAMEWYLRSRGLEPRCAYPGCKHEGWDKWKGTLEVHHTFGGDLPPNPPKVEDGWLDVLAYLQVACRNHHGKFDFCVEKRQLPVLWKTQPKIDFFMWLAYVRMNDPRTFWLTPRLTLLLSWELDLDS